MFSIPPNGYKTDENLEGKRHCILVTATNPFPLPVPVYRPNFDNTGGASPCHDVETVAGWFGRCSVSLSVICPRKLPRIRALYEAGQRSLNPEAYTVQNLHPDFLVLISEDFKEALAALNFNRVDRNRDGFSMSHPVGTFAANQSVTLRTGKSLDLCDAILPRALDKDPDARYLSSSAIVNNVSDLLQKHESNLSLSGPLSKTVLSSEKANSSVVSRSEAKTGISHVENSDGSSSSVAKLEAKVSSLGVLERSSTTAITEQNAKTVEGISTVVASSTRTSVVGLPQTLKADVRSESSNANTAVSQGTSTEKPKYFKVWEGNLVRLKQGNAVVITKLEAYSKASASLTLAADWRESIKVVDLMPLDRVLQEYKVRTSGVMIFRVVNQHPFIVHLFEKNLCALTEVPNQMLLLSGSDKPTRLIGMLFPKDPQMPNTNATSAAAVAVFEAEDAQG